MKNMSQRRFWAGKAHFWQTAVSPTPVPDRNSIPWEPDMKRSHSSTRLKIARSGTLCQLKIFCPTKTEQNQLVHENTKRPRCRWHGREVRLEGGGTGTPILSVLSLAGG